MNKSGFISISCFLCAVLCGFLCSEIALTVYCIYNHVTTAIVTDVFVWILVDLGKIDEFACLHADIVALKCKERKKPGFS